MFAPILPGAYQVFTCPASLIDQGVINTTTVAVKQGSIFALQLLEVCKPFIF